MQISATHLSVIWTFWVMVWYMNTLFIYWLYLGSSPSYNDTPPSVFGYFFPPSIWENRVIDLLVENPLFIWKCVTCQLWLGILCIKKKKKKILVDILPQLFNFEVPQLSQRQIWSMITLPGTFHAGLSSLLLLSFFISSEVKCQNWKWHHAWAD